MDAFPSSRRKGGCNIISRVIIIVNVNDSFGVPFSWSAHLSHPFGTSSSLSPSSHLDVCVCVKTTYMMDRSVLPVLLLLLLLVASGKKIAVAFPARRPVCWPSFWRDSITGQLAPIGWNAFWGEMHLNDWGPFGKVFWEPCSRRTRRQNADTKNSGPTDDDDETTDAVLPTKCFITC